MSKRIQKKFQQTTPFFLRQNEWRIDVFTGNNDWEEYHSKTIHELCSKRGITFRDKKISVEAVNELLKAGAYNYESADDMPRDILAIYYRYDL